MIERKSPLGRAYISNGWRCIYAARLISRGKAKGSFEVRYIDLREGQPAYVRAVVPDYRTMEGEVVNG
jgi:hypothetical protein